MAKKAFHSTASGVLDELKKTMDSIDEEEVEQLIKEIDCASQVFLVGVGRVMLVLQCMAKRFAHLGIDVHCVGEITEPAITEKDLLIVGSGSGYTMFPVGIAKKAKEKGAKVIHIGSNTEGELKDIADAMVRIPVQTKLYRDDEIKSIQPMTSLFEQALLLLGDIIAMMMIDKKELDMKSLWKYHANLE